MIEREKPHMVRPHLRFSYLITPGSDKDNEQRKDNFPLKDKDIGAFKADTEVESSLMSQNNPVYV